MNHVEQENILFPKVALGTWAWGSGINGSKSIFGENVSQQELEQVFYTACDKGFSLWDTAPIYGIGSSENMLGIFSKNRKIQISTNFLLWEEFRRIFHDITESASVLSASYSGIIPQTFSFDYLFI